MTFKMTNIIKHLYLSELLATCLNVPLYTTHLLYFYTKPHILCSSKMASYTPGNHMRTGLHSLQTAVMPFHLIMSTIIHVLLYVPWTSCFQCM